MHAETERSALESLPEGFYYLESLRSPDFARRGPFYLNGRQKA
jgi:hypothetical protein